MGKSAKYNLTRRHGKRSSSFLDLETEISTEIISGGFLFLLGKPNGQGTRGPECEHLKYPW